MKPANMILERSFGFIASSTSIVINISFISILQFSISIIKSHLHFLNIPLYLKSIKSTKRTLFWSFQFLWFRDFTLQNLIRMKMMVIVSLENYSSWDNIDYIVSSLKSFEARRMLVSNQFVHAYIQFAFTLATISYRSCQAFLPHFFFILSHCN